MIAPPSWKEQAVSSGSGVTLPALQFDPSNSEVWLLLGRGSSTDLASPPSRPKQGGMVSVGLGFFPAQGSRREK